MGVASFFRPSTNPREWAADEAAERMRRRDAGMDVVPGVNYAAVRYMQENGAISEEAAEALQAGAIAPRHLPKKDSTPHAAHAPPPAVGHKMV